jgi:AraC-like DNA-binding protein
MDKKYYKHKLENLLVISKIVTIHYFEFDKNFVSHVESHDFWELVYADKGDLICSRDGHEEILKEGEVLFHKPGAVHALRADGKRAPNVFIISFECKNEAIRFFEDRHLAVDNSLRRFIFSIIEESKRTFDLPYSDPELKKMKLLETPTLGGQQLIKNYLELLLINLMRNETEKSSSEAVFLPREQFDELISDRVIEYMQEHITEKLSVSDICETMHYNKSYVFRRFKKTTGSSLMAYFTKMKIQKAKEMLRSDYGTLSDIAQSLGYASIYDFSRDFKKHTGVSPSKY